MNILDRIPYKYRKYCIPNLMLYIVVGMAIVFVSDLMIYPQLGFSISGLLGFDKEAILQGQVWRTVSFAFMPPNTSFLFMAFSLYFYWMIGSAMESTWGSFKFNIYYLIGFLGTVAAGLLTGYATNYYLNMSLFFAFAASYPDMEVRLFFLLPIKIKWLALLDGALFLYSFVFSGWGARVALLVSIANFLLFFGGDFIGRIRSYRRKSDFRRDFKE